MIATVDTSAPRQAAPRHPNRLLMTTARVVGLVAILSAVPAHAEDFAIVDQPLPNGDFGQGLAEWTVEVSPDSTTPPGTVEVVGGVARIVKGGAFLAGLSQDFAAPEGLVALRLRIAEFPVFASDGGFIPEAFDVHVKEVPQSGETRLNSL